MIKTIAQDLELAIDEAYPVFDDDILGYLRDIEMFLFRLEDKQNQIIQVVNSLSPLDTYALKEIDSKLLKLLRKDENNIKK